MALKTFNFCLFIILFLNYVSLSESHDVLKALEPPAFDFIKQLQGSRKGQNVSGLRNLKTYLVKFGYLNHNHQVNNDIHPHDDNFDDLLESAIKKYQANYHITPTGVVDSQTVARMITPRCGIPDNVNNSFSPNLPRWPVSKTHLTYAFPSNTDSRVVKAVANALATWAKATHFTFSRAQAFSTADIKVSFHKGDHGDGSAFDGVGGIIAHAFTPTDGRFHYDADERWDVGPVVEGTFDLETVALHEIGHLLGLGHSPVEDSIMFSLISSGVTKGLHSDDIQGIKALYHDV